jgi:hypothetical protein
LKIASLSIAALALLQASDLPGQPTVADQTYANPLAGSWSYAAAAGGSEAVFRDSSARAQLTIRCTRATRRISIAKAATGAAPFLSIWTSSATRSAPASYNPATGLLTADFAAQDAILDAIAYSRGRIAFSAGSAPALVLPPWAEPSRVVEDCRS